MAVRSAWRLVSPIRGRRRAARQHEPARDRGCHARRSDRARRPIRRRPSRSRSATATSRRIVEPAAKRGVEDRLRAALHVRSETPTARRKRRTMRGKRRSSRRTWCRTSAASGTATARRTNRSPQHPIGRCLRSMTIGSFGRLPHRAGKHILWGDARAVWLGDAPRLCPDWAAARRLDSVGHRPGCEATRNARSPCAPRWRVQSFGRPRIP